MSSKYRMGAYKGDGLEDKIDAYARSIDKPEFEKMNSQDELVYYTFLGEGNDRYLIIAKSVPTVYYKTRKVIVAVKGPVEERVDKILSGFLRAIGLSTREAMSEDIALLNKEGLLGRGM